MQVLESLLQLQALESGKEPSSSDNSAAQEVRKKIPLQVLIHYDRLRGRDKKGIAFVRNGVCGGCHMQVAVGLLAFLHRDDNVYRCENCGAYLCLAPEPAPVLEMPPRAVKPGRRGRPRKLPAHAE
jgi:predicted  nucleic acid-binding Zn-ribbon protein